MPGDAPGDRNVATTDPGLAEAIRVDLEHLYGSWMGLLFPRQRRDAHSVLGRWRPSTALGKAKYRLWGALGVIALLIAYPLAVLGFAARFHARKIDRSAASIGLLGVLLLSIVAWGGLTVFARFRFPFEGFVAVGAAGAVATVSAVLAWVFTRSGRFVSVFLGYPFAVTAIFLPPVVAALHSPALADVVFSGSDTIAVWLLNEVFDVYRLNEKIRYYFDLEGVAYVGMWFAIAVPIGWFLGVLVELANVVRPADSNPGSSEEAA